MYSPAAMLNAPASRPAIAGEEDEVAVLAVGRGPGDAHDQGEVADEAVADAEDHGPERPRPARAVPALARRRCRRSGWYVGVLQLPPDLGVLALVGGDRRDLRRATGSS